MSRRGSTVEAQELAGDRSAIHRLDRSAPGELRTLLWSWAWRALVAALGAGAIAGALVWPRRVLPVFVGTCAGLCSVVLLLGGTWIDFYHGRRYAIPSTGVHSSGHLRCSPPSTATGVAWAKSPGGSGRLRATSPSSMRRSAATTGRLQAVSPPRCASCISATCTRTRSGSSRAAGWPPGSTSQRAGFGIGPMGYGAPVRQVGAGFAASAQAVPLSREFLRDHLPQWGADDLEADASLLLTELVANVVRHARTPLTVRIELEPPTLRVEVCDGSPKMPEIAEVADEGGYGCDSPPWPPTGGRTTRPREGRLVRPHAAWLNVACCTTLRRRSSSGRRSAA